MKRPLRLEAQFDEARLGIGAGRPLVVDPVAAELIPFHPQPGLGRQLASPDDGGLQADVGLIGVDQLQRLLARIHMLPRLDKVVVHHPVERREDVASAQLLLNLAHLHPRQPLGQFSLLHVVARLVVLALGSALLTMQGRQPAKLGAGKAHVALPLGLLGLGLLQREPQRRAVEAQQLIPLADLAAELGDPLHPAAHLGAERRLLAARHRAADPDAGRRLPRVTSARVTILPCASAGNTPPPAAPRPQPSL